MIRLADQVDKIYLAVGYTDLRKSIDGLALEIQLEFDMDPLQNCLFLFCGKRRDRIKGLLWQKDGFLLLYKRLDNGKFQWPRNNKELKEITQQQYRWLLEGLKIEQPNVIKPSKVQYLL